MRSPPCGLSGGRAAPPSLLPRCEAVCVVSIAVASNAPELATRAGRCVARPSGNKHVVTKRAERCRGRQSVEVFARKPLRAVHCAEPDRADPALLTHTLATRRKWLQC